MKNVLKRIAAFALAFVLVLGLVPFAANAANHTGGRVYFETNWTNPCIQLMIGHSGYSIGYPMTKEAGNRYYVDVPTWDGAWDFAVFGTDGEWGGENNSIANRKKWAPNSTGVDNSGYQFQSGKKYLITSTGSDNVSVKEVFSVNVATPTNGTITISKTLAAAGESVLIIATPASGYDLESIVYEPDGQSKVYINAVDNQYSFQMPSANVTVSATFKRHTHTWSFTGLQTDKVTASCGCGAKETLQIHAPDLQNGSYNATLSDGNGGQAPATLGGLTVGNIRYGTATDKLLQAPTTSGEYIASVTIGDESFAKVEYKIEKKQPVIPTGLVAYYSNTLADITLPTGWRWTWDNPSTPVGDVGIKTFKASFDGDANTEAVTAVDLTVEVKPSAVELTVTTDKTEYTYGDIVKITVVRTPTGKPATEPVSVDDSLKNVVVVGEPSEDDPYVDMANLPYYAPGGVTVEVDTAKWKVAPGALNWRIVVAPDGNVEMGGKDFSIKLNKADPEVVAPTASAIINGQTLADSTLTGGSATGVGGQAVTGTFSWEDATIKPTVADSETTEYTVVFTPDDTVSYNTTTCKVKLTVDPLMHTVTLDPNYGSETAYTEAVEDGTGLAYPAESYEPYREHYRFDGWFASDDNGTTFTGEAVDLDTLTVTTDVTLYAKWTRVYDLFVEGIQATEYNASDMLGDGTVSYDPTTNTLTLNNASLEGVNTAEHGGSAIAYFGSGDETLTIQLKGNNTAKALENSQYQTIAIEVHLADLVITGSGNLTATAAAAAGTVQEASYGIHVVNGSLTMNGSGTVFAIAEAETRNTYCLGIITRNDVIVNSGTLKAFANKDTAATDASCGIQTGSDVKVNGGKLIAYSGATDALHARGIEADKVFVSADGSIEVYGTEMAIFAWTDVTVEEAKRVLEVKDEKDDESKYLKTVAGEEWEDYDYVKTVPAFTVTFVADGQTVDTQTVASGEDATLPEVPAREGYTGEWDSDGKNITTDTTITAQYEKISTGGNAGGSDNPDTGDSSNLILWSVLGIASLLCVAVLLVILYRKKGKYQSR